MEKELKKKNITRIVLIVLSILLFLSSVSALLYLLHTKNVITLPFIKGASIIKIDEKKEDKTVKLNTYTGKHISAKLPDTWTITEYENGQGSDMLTSGATYTGLTGLIIKHGDNKVFTMKAVNGIGFEGCAEYAIFEDNSSSYYQEMQDINDEFGLTMKTYNYLETNYSEFTWFGEKFRRVEDKYFYDSKEGNQYFEPPCVQGFASFNELTFKYDNYSSHSYFFGATDTATEEELVTLDSILSSMEEK